MANIKFNYLYRDAGNYKNFGFVIFRNLTNLSLSEFEDFLTLRLIGEQYFYADEWHIPDLHSGTWNNKFDHTFHEFESIEYTSEPPNTSFNVIEFKEIIEAINKG
jgi:hypothetical protein